MSHLRPVLLLCAALAISVSAQEATLTEVSGARALETVKILSDDSFGGRKSGLPSGRHAEAWMAEQVRALGLLPLEAGSHFHEFKANVTEDGPAALLVAKGGEGRPEREGKYLADYVTLLYSGKGALEAPVVFVGYGVHEPAKGRDDYAGLDVAGKIVMAVRGVPEGSAFNRERFIGYKSSTAFDRGARGFLLVEGDEAIPGTIQEEFFREELPAVWMARGAADDLLARGGKEDLAAQVKALAAGELRSFQLEGVTARIEIQARLLKDQTVRNVVGIWPGTGSEYVVLGAHLDHVGTDAVGNVYNGADDNASGSSMLLEVARAIAANKRTFARSILFVWFAGEEQGLLGSWAFVKQPPIPLEKIALMLNTDMVGQGQPRLAIAGGEVYPRDEEYLGGFDEEDFSWKPFRGQPNSDHYPFQASGVPAYFMHTEGPHPNYHKPGDDWQNIQPELLEMAGRYLRRLAERAAVAEVPFCRPLRYGEYLWQDSFVLDLVSGEAAPRTCGVDLHVKWFGSDLVAVDAELTRLEMKENKETAPLLPGALPSPLLNDLRATALIGMRGDAASLLHRPARRMGVFLFAPWWDATQEVSVADLVAASQGRPLVLCMEGAPGEVQPAGLHAPLLLSIGLALPHAEAMKARNVEWIAYYQLRPLDENKSDGHAEVAREILRARELLGAERVIVVPGNHTEEVWSQQAPTLTAGVVEALLAAGLKPVQIKQLLGGNFVAMLERLRKS